tara:strand:+ start:343 stop:771 length:429 start_codon:yes stop_codon:yes gene_type:complete
MPNFDKPTGFTMKMGSKEIYDESSPFSMRDTALMKASPMLKPLKGNQDKLSQELKQAILDSPMNKNGKDKIKTEELDNVTVTAKSPKTIADNVRQNQERTMKNRLYAKTDKEKKDIAQGKFSRSRKDVSDQDYRIYKKTNKS